MRIDIEPSAISFEELKSKLEDKFPEYKFRVRSKNFLIVSKSGVIGANVILRRDRIQVAGNFPTMISQFLFIIALLFTAFILALIIFFVVVNPRMRNLENEISEYILEILPEKPEMVKNEPILEEDYT